MIIIVRESKNRPDTANVMHGSVETFLTIGHRGHLSSCIHRNSSIDINAHAKENTYLCILLSPRFFLVLDLYIQNAAWVSIKMATSVRPSVQILAFSDRALLIAMTAKITAARLLKPVFSNLQFGLRI